MTLFSEHPNRWGTWSGKGILGPSEIWGSVIHTRELTADLYRAFLSTQHSARLHYYNLISQRLGLLDDGSSSARKVAELRLKP